MTQSLDFSKIPPLSEDQIDQKSYKLADLWMIHYKKKIYGPYHIDLMHKVAIKHTTELEMSSACNLARGKWYYLFDNKEFQNRNDQTFFKPVVVTDEPLLIYTAEKEQGPYDLAQVLGMLKKRTIKHSDLFSMDSGESWKKIYEIDGLDRRQKDEGQIKLPDIPDMSAYSQEQITFLKQSPNNHNVVLELKKIDPVNKKKQTAQRQARNNNTRSKSSIKSKPSKSSSSTLWLIILAVILGLAWMMKAELSQLFFEKQPQTTNRIKRKVSKYQLKAKKRKIPRVRLAEPVSSNRDTPKRRIQQKEYDSSVEDNLEVNNTLAEGFEDESSDSQQNQRLKRTNRTRSAKSSTSARRGTRLKSRALTNRFVDDQQEDFARDDTLGSGSVDQDLFLQTDTDETLDDIDQEYLIPESDFIGLDSENFVPLDGDEDEYYDSEENY